MEKEDVIEFFNQCAPSWDAETIKSDEIIGKILDNAEVSEGMDILDVACGTGVMLPYYLERNAAHVTAVDISPEMVKRAVEKFGSEPRVRIICGDVEEMVFDRQFDRIVVYNAFPHFPDPRRLIRILSGLLKENGRLTIAHGASREAIDSHHHGKAQKVSNGLMEADRLKNLFDACLKVEVVISNSRMYQVSGVKLPAGSTAESHTDGNVSTEELPALMKYMVRHNDAHLRELSQLASQLRKTGKEQEYRQLAEIVDAFRDANSRLDEVRLAITE